MTSSAEGTSKTLDPDQVERAVQLGLLVNAAYAMHARDPDALTPPPGPDFVPGYDFVAWVQMEDFFSVRKFLQFYGFIARSQSQPAEFALAIRGTSGAVEWFDDLTSMALTPFLEPGLGWGEVGFGFQEIYKTMRVCLSDSRDGRGTGRAADVPRHIRRTGGRSGPPSRRQRRAGESRAPGGLARAPVDYGDRSQSRVGAGDALCRRQLHQGIQGRHAAALHVRVAARRGQGFFADVQSARNGIRGGSSMCSIWCRTSRSSGSGTWTPCISILRVRRR